MNRYIRPLLLGVLSLGLSAGAVAAGDAEAGKAKTATCAACHGQKGMSIAPDYPNLAGQNEKYLVKSIKAYKSGARKDPIMKPMVMALSDVDIENIAAYYSSLACK